LARSTGTPTISDVAKAARVSRQTVSNVINRPDLVRPETRRRVEGAIERLRYRPHASARRLRTRRSSTIGIRLDPVSANGISGSVLDGFLHALTERAAERGIRILLYAANGIDAELAEFRRLIDESEVDGFVVTSTTYGDRRIPWLVEQRIPFVSFGRPWGVADMTDRRYRWVDVDGAAGVRMATEHVQSLGAREVAFVGWPSPSGIGEERRQGWIESCGLAPERMAELSVGVADEATEAARAVAELLDSSRPPDAFVCASDSLALGARMALVERGLELPVVGFDDTPVAAAMGLSSVSQPLSDVAEAVLELLMGPDGGVVIDDPDRLAGPTHRLLQPELVVRGEGASAREEGKETCDEDA